MNQNWNRFYEASFGRFLEPEPKLSESPRYAIQLAEQGIPVGVYAYAENNAIHFVDPTGRAINASCLVACIQETDPLNLSSIGLSDATDWYIHRLPVLWTPVPKTWLTPSLQTWGLQEGAQPATTLFRLLNIWVKDNFGSAAGLESMTVKQLGRKGQCAVVAAGAVELGVISACSAQCNE